MIPEGPDPENDAPQSHIQSLDRKATQIASPSQAYAPLFLRALRALRGNSFIFFRTRSSGDGAIATLPAAIGSNFYFLSRLDW